MSEKRIKVTDRRMFTPDGELRDMYKETGEGASSKEASKTTAASKPTAAPQSTEALKTEAASKPAPAAPAQATPEAPKQEEEPLESGATFQDLVGLLGQSASVYLAQSAQRIENRGEMLEMAKMHVDLLAIVKQKTQGNLQPAEQALLDDALYQLRMAFVQQG